MVCVPALRREGSEQKKAPLEPLLVQEVATEEKLESSTAISTRSPGAPAVPAMFSWEASVGTAEGIANDGAVGAAVPSTVAVTVRDRVSPVVRERSVTVTAYVARGGFPV